MITRTAAMLLALIALAHPAWAEDIAGSWKAEFETQRGLQKYTFALKPDGSLAWKSEPGGPYTTTPVAYGDVLYAVRDEGIFTAYDLATGTRLYQERTRATHAASPLASDGRLYLATENGEVMVVKAGRQFEVLARNDMGEPCMATPAIADGKIYIRTRSALYCFANRD